jgi:O-antigen ligase
VFGCGLGGFKSNFMKFQSAAQEFEIEFAHNDYLDYLAELGLIGFAIILVIVFGLVRQTLLGVWRQPDESRRFLQIACSASLICILLHSIVDFNMHIEANAMTLAWIAGAGSISGPNPRTT